MKVFLPCVITAIALLAAQESVYSQKAEEKIKRIIADQKGEFGLAWKHLESGETGFVNKKRQFPMQSVFKFPLALAIMDLVDQGKCQLDQQIQINREDYWPTWSPIMKKYPEGNVRLSLQEIMMYNLAYSDNVACDILFRVAGGPRVVNRFIHSIGVTNISIISNEREMHSAWDLQFQNWCHPEAMLKILEKLYNGKILSPESNSLIRKMMEETVTGPKRIKGQLPEGTVVAHRTGTGGKNEQGISGALNDAGVITLPDGTHLIVVTFISRSPEPEPKQEETIALISKALYDHYKK